MARTAFLTHESFLAHNTGPAHPECADRLRAILHKVKHSEIAGDLVTPRPEPVPVDEAERCHDRRVVAMAVLNTQGPGLHYLDLDTVVGPESLEAACRAIGAGRLAADLIVAGEVNNAFCAVRPPGHHATPFHSMGFCIFNNVALLARYVQDQYGAERVLIVDWDVHHGNGTQDIFYEDPSVLYFSVHQYPHYPGTGSARETGRDRGVGATINVPLAAGATDEDYVDVFDRVLAPAAEAFVPDWVLVSAGFDAHRADPLGGMDLTARGFATLTGRVLDIAHKFANGRCISYLEGGYDLDGLADSVVAHLERMQGATVVMK